MSEELGFFFKYFLPAVIGIIVFAAIVGYLSHKEGQQVQNLYDTNPREYCRLYGFRDVRCTGAALR